MRKSLLYLLFRAGRVPKTIMPALYHEGIVLLEEGLRGSLTARGLRMPGRVSSYRKTGFAGSLVLTRERFAAFAFSRPMVNVPLDEDKLALLDLSVPREGLLSIKFDMAQFQPESTGLIECRYRTSNAEMFLEKLQEDR